MPTTVTDTAKTAYLGQNCVTPYCKREIFLRMLWVVVQKSLFRWSPAPLHRWRAFLLLLFGATIEKPGQVVIFPTADIYFPWKLTLHPRSMVGPHTIIYNLDRVTLAYGANVSQRSHLCAGSHDYTRWSMPVILKPITIGRNAWVAAEVFIGPGVTIGELAVIGARSVVLKNQPERKICAGNPCQPVKDRVDPV